MRRRRLQTTVRAAAVASLPILAFDVVLVVLTAPIPDVGQPVAVSRAVIRMRLVGGGFDLEPGAVALSADVANFAATVDGF